MNILYFIIALLGIIGVPYFCLIQRRKSKYRKIAQKLGGQYLSGGIFKTGKIKFVQTKKNSIEKMFLNLTINPETIYKDIDKKLAFPTLIRIEKDMVTLDIAGLILKVDTIKRYVTLIEEFAELIENEPIPL
jgi:hypothetical protein